MPDEPEPCPEPRRVFARLNPDLIDSPLRRALRAADLHAPFGLADDGQPEQEPTTP